MRNSSASLCAVISALKSVISDFADSIGLAESLRIFSPIFALSSATFARISKIFFANSISVCSFLSASVFASAAAFCPAALFFASRAFSNPSRVFSKSFTPFFAASVATLVSFSTWAGSNNKFETESVSLFLRLPTFAKVSSDKSPALFNPSVSKSTPANKAASGNEIKFKSPSKIVLFLFAASI